MNWDSARGNWTLFKGNMKLQWGKLTDDHLSKIAGRHDRLNGKVQKTYATTKQAAEETVKEFVGPLKDDGPRI
ncbi:MAG: CsbD family protein [Sulfuricaulis sp.]